MPKGLEERGRTGRRVYGRDVAWVGGPSELVTLSVGEVRPQEKRCGYCFKLIAVVNSGW